MAGQRLHAGARLELRPLLQVSLPAELPCSGGYSLRSQPLTAGSCHALCSSAGEASAPDDVLWLMARAGYKPVIDSCGGKRSTLTRAINAIHAPETSPMHACQ